MDIPPTPADTVQMNLCSRVSVEWRPEYSVNVRALDAQHRNLLRQIDTLQNAMLEGLARDVIGDILMNLISYTHSHFAFEIALLRKHSYPGLAEHEADHEELTRQVLDFQRRFLSGKLVAGAPVMLFLQHWLSDHIACTDRKFAAFLNSHNVF